MSIPRAEACLGARRAWHDGGRGGAGGAGGLAEGAQVEVLEVGRASHHPLECGVWHGQHGEAEKELGGGDAARSHLCESGKEGARISYLPPEGCEPLSLFEETNKVCWSNERVFPGAGIKVLQCGWSEVTSRGGV